MALFTIQIVDAAGNIKTQDSAEEFASLVYKGVYEPGDHIQVETSEKNIHVWLQVDDVLAQNPGLLPPCRCQCGDPWRGKILCL